MEQKFDSFSEEPSLKKDIPGIPTSCVQCHVGKNPEGGYLPFNNPFHLNKLLNIKNGNAFFKTVMNRVNHPIPQLRMPPGDKPLTIQQKTELEQTLKKIQGKRISGEDSDFLD